MNKILVVDDEARLRDFLREALTAQGYRVVTVPSAAQALGVVLQESFELVVLDLKLAGESGIDVLKKMREARVKTPVIIYSGALTPEIEKEAKAAGADETLGKGLGIDALVAQIKKILNAQDRISPEPLKKKEPRILVVDDEEPIRKLLKNFLAQKGYQTLEAENGQKAVEAVSSQAVSVVLLDMQMPHMDGLATLKKLLEINPRLGVVMATGIHDDESVKKALALGACGYVLKPFDLLYLELVLFSRLMTAETNS